jgi:hypothetical protein
MMNESFYEMMKDEQFMKLLKFLCSGLLAGLIIILSTGVAYPQATYLGTQGCQGCHSGPPGGNQYTPWAKSLHSQIHLLPDANTVKGNFTQTVSMGAAYGNAQVILRIDGGKYFAKVGTNGQEYEIKFTYGGGWKQRYLVKISDSYYMLPIQWNLNKYLDNSSGAWAAYNPQNWFDATGTPKSTSTNAFRKVSWDKNCSGCHITGNSIQRVVAGNDTSYVSTWANNSSVQNIVVGCESCHGPGSLHPANAFLSDKKILNPAKLTDNDRKLEVCGQCHFRGFSNNSTYEYPWDENANKSYLPGEILSGFITNKPGVWPDNVTARQHHQQFQEFLTNKHYTNPFQKLNCMTCHDPHKAPGDHQVVDSLQVGADKFKVSNKDNTLCLSCHATHGPFANITKAMVKDPVTNRSAIAAEVSKHTFHAYDPENGLSRCSTCHMSTTAVTAKAYDIHTHTFEVVPPQKTKIHKDKGGMPNACAVACHRNASGKASLGVGADASLTTWNEVTDLALADSLMKYYGPNGIWWKRDITVGVADRGKTETIPSSFSLSQNFPNPFNPTTAIQYELKEKSWVMLKVYNMLGQEVVTLIDRAFIGAGKYTITFDASELPSGMYIYRLTANNFTAMKKMLFVR